MGGLGGVGGSGGGTAGSAGVGGSGGTGGNAGTGGIGGSGGAETDKCKPPGPGTCDPIAQCGCSAPNACYHSNYTTGETKCASSGSMPVSSACYYLNDCAAGSVCFDGGCKRYCSNDNDCPGLGAVCFQVANGSTPIPGFKLCTDHCVPWADTTCKGGLGCIPFSEDGKKPGTTSCAWTNTSTTTCTAASGYACAKGYLCMIDNTCRKMCRRTVPTDCPTGKTCLRVGVAGMYFENEEIGVCSN